MMMMTDNILYPLSYYDIPDIVLGIQLLDLI